MLHHNRFRDFWICICDSSEAVSILLQWLFCHSNRIRFVQIQRRVHNISSMVTLVEWEVSIPAVPVVISSTLSTVAVARVLKMTLDGNAFCVLFKKFRKPDMG